MADDSPTITPTAIGIIGGEGQMGAMFRRLFEADGFAVRVAGPLDDPDYGGLVSSSDVVIVTVPISETVAVIERIAPMLRTEQLLSDFTSVKAEPVAAMLATEARVIGCHPMFAPMPSTAGQNVVLCPSRPGEYLDWYREFFQSHGMSIVLMQPDEHDEAMAFVQGLTHFINIVFARTLQTRNAKLEQILQVCSPIYRMLFANLCRILSGDAHLYGQIQISNRNNPPLLAEFLENGRSFLQQVESRSWEEVYKVFDEAATFLGDYREVAREESDYLIEQMTRRLQNGELHNVGEIDR